jgi:hypothetical protein
MCMFISLLNFCSFLCSTLSMIGKVGPLGKETHTNRGKAISEAREWKSLLTIPKSKATRQLSSHVAKQD